MSMQIVRSVAELRAVLRPVRLSERTVGLVPTMGAFHDGHRSLMERAAECNDLVVVSLFVNPTQFGRNEDLSKYPRNEARDAAIAEAAGVDVLFAPPVEEVYPSGHATSIRVGGVTESLEGAHRPGHFDGVATVVAKLFNMVQPDVAYFGQKDAQQALVIRKLVRDLDIPVRVEICPTVREADGLAMSSRNAYLDGDDRIQAVALRRALDAAERAVEKGERDAERVSAAARAVLAEHAIEPEYVALVGPETMTPVQRVDGEVLMALAARVGPARLIDNTILSVPDATPEPAA